MKAWKFLDLTGDGSIESRSGNHTWKIGEWYHVAGEIVPCNQGFHCSGRIYDAFTYVTGSVLAEVEVRGDHADEDDKSAWSDMRIIRAWKFGKQDSVALAIFAAELVIGDYESQYPGDDRPRKAIDAAKAWLASPSDETRSAAGSAARSAARSAWSAARSAAESAAWSAESAARFAESAAESAARSAESAAWSAESAAWSAESAARFAESAARFAVLDQVEDWFQTRLSVLEEIPAA